MRILVLLLAVAAPDGGVAELRDAPTTLTGNAPSEAELSPPPDAEKVPAVPGFVEVDNPAFPQAEVRSVAMHRGRRFDPESIKPYFGEGVLAQAKAELDAGRPQEARRLLTGAGDSPPVRYLRALAALRGSESRAAATEMSALADQYPAMRDRCLTHAGVALEELELWKDAEARFAEVPRGSRLYVDARFGLARALRKQRLLQRAREALAPVAMMPAPPWGRDVGAEALIATADLSREAKDGEGEKEALAKLWSLHPRSPLAALAEKRLAPPAGKATSRTSEAMVARAEVLLDQHLNQESVDLIAPLLPALKLPDPLACRAHFAHGKAHRKLRLHTKAIAALTPVAEKCTDPDLRARALYVLGTSLSISDLPRAPANYELLAREFPSHSFADDALFFAADVYFKLGKTEAGLERLAEVVKSYPSGDYAGDALFKIFWIQREAKQLEKALATLKQIEELFASEVEGKHLDRALYWHARLLDKAPEAVALYARLAQEHPSTYYGLLARGRLETLDPAKAAEVAAQLTLPGRTEGPWPLFAGPMSEDPHFLAGVELLRLGFPEAVSSELWAVSHTGQPTESLRLLVMLFAQAGDLRSAQWVARKSLPGDLSGPITADKRAVWEVAYPLAFRELIERHCAEAKIEPDLLQALMREESALDPQIRSWAGAIGLTQLMPGTAFAAAARLKLKRPKVEQLTEPDLNIRLGSNELGTLHRRYAGVKQYALAGYNAGAHAVDKWRRDRPDAETDVWVEEIPIEETRSYVKRVLRTYNAYRLLYARSAAPLAGGR
jgi:soluble lytic murein transglycosylase